PGASLGAGGVLGLFTMVACTLLGRLPSALGVSVIVFIIAFCLGSRFETTLSPRSSPTGGSLYELANSPVALALLVVNLA
ncbi:Tricarboxylate transporter family protein, partial [Tritonibacter sp. SIMBA_163]